MDSIMRWIIIVGFTVLSYSSPAQSFENLVFEGGGMRGVSYAGALSVLAEQGHLKNIKRVGGTLVGAITALMLALGYTPGEIEKEIAKTNPRKFNDGTVLFLGGPTRLRKHFGWYKGKQVSRWIGGLIEKKLGDEEITFAQLHQMGRPGLYVTGTSLNNQRVIVFSHETYPNMNVREAVRASMSIPFFFKPVIIDSSGHLLKKPMKDHHHDIVVDGGFIANYPIELFDSIAQDGNRISNPATLGIRLDTPGQLEFDKQQKGLAPWPVYSFRNFVGAFYNFILENLNRSNLTAADWNRTIAIRSELVGAKIKRLQPNEREAMMAAGRQATLEYLRKLEKK